MSYTFSLSRRSLPVRCLCLLLIVLVLWCFFMVPRAGAVAVEAATVAYGGLLVGTILVGAGVVFSSHGDMAKAGAAMYRTLQKGNTAIASKIAAISVWAVEHGKKIGSAALRIGKDLYQGIVDAFNASYSDGSISIGGPVAEGIYINSAANYAAAKSLFGDGNHYRTIYIDSDSYSWRIANGQAVVYWSVPDQDYWHIDLDASHGSYQCYFRLISSNGYADKDWAKDKLELHFYVKYSDGDWEREILDRFYLNSRPWVGTYPEGGEKISVGASDVAYPSDNYLVRMPDIPSVDTATGDITYPNDTAYTKDAVAVPYPVDTEGVKVPDIPYDKVVDQSTGKALDDTGTDTDNPSKPGEGTDTGSNTGLLQKILDLLKNFFDSPSDFRLNMDGFRNLAIADKFPFCIPFDLVDSIKQFAVTAKDFHFRIKLDTHYFKVDHEVDLSDMVLPFAFFRYMVLVWFVWMLMLRTRDLVKW